MLAIDRMRLLDRWVGVPLCWLATRLGRRRGGLPPAPRRVVFLQLAESGSNVLADPAVRRWMARAPEPTGYVTFAPNRGSLAITGTLRAEDIFVIDPSSLASLARDVWRLRAWLRGRSADTLVDLELFTRASALICWFCATPRRIGFHAEGAPGLYRGALYTDPVAFDFDTHIARNYLALVEPLTGEPVPAGLPAIARRQIGPDAAGRVDVLLRRLFGPIDGTLVLVNANASDLLPQRRWPLAHFQQFIERLLAAAPTTRVLLTGAADDRTTTGELARRVGDPRCADGAGQCSLEDLPALCHRAALMLTNDSGPAHFASVTALPILVMFGPETPLRFGPLGRATVFSAGLPCSPCVHAANQRRSDCADNRCMQAIGVDAVLDEALNILRADGPAAGRGAHAASPGRAAREREPA